VGCDVTLKVEYSPPNRNADSGITVLIKNDKLRWALVYYVEGSTSHSVCQHPHTVGLQRNLTRT
jgi:hypothetical protein